MNLCECGNRIPVKTIIGHGKKDLRGRSKCLKCVPYKSSSTRGEPKSKKRAANNQAVTSYRQRMKERAIAHLGGACWVCQYTKCKSALTFHHIDASTKAFGISDGRTRRWDVVVAELEKCVLLCCRCHEEVHSGLVDLALVINERTRKESNLLQSV